MENSFSSTIILKWNNDHFKMIPITYFGERNRLDKLPKDSNYVELWASGTRLWAHFNHFMYLPCNVILKQKLERN